MRPVVRSALRVSAASAVWTFTASVAAAAIGLVDASIALVAFGLVQLFDFAADVVLVIQFRAAATAEHLERIVLRVVALGLIALGVVTAAVSVVHLHNGQGPTHSGAAIMLAVVSFGVLSVLALRKWYVAKRVPSRALHADGRLTGVGAVLAAVTVAGATSAEAFDLPWMDPAAALVISTGAIGMGVATKLQTRST